MRNITHQGPSENDSQFCDYVEVDLDVDCDDEDLWRITDGDRLIGLVCTPHKGAYLFVYGSIKGE